MATSINKQGARRPEQDINCWVFAGMLEDILNADDDDDPFCFAITTWAIAAWESATIDWIFDNPTETIHIKWPCWPVGRDNQRLHESYNYWRKRYIEDNPGARFGAKPRIANAGKPQPETDPQKMNNSNSSIELAKACKHKWQSIGQTLKR